MTGNATKRHNLEWAVKKKKLSLWIILGCIGVELCALGRNHMINVVLSCTVQNQTVLTFIILSY